LDVTQLLTQLAFWSRLFRSRIISFFNTFY
jgi:hypothetical protein